MNSSANNRVPMRDALLRGVLQRMDENPDLMLVSADFGSPVLDELQRQFPDQVVNVGIAEQNLVNVATGLALEGCTVIAYAIAPFITMRCYEQIRVNLAILSQVRPLNVNLVGVGAGCSYTMSGPTHQCLEDLAIMRALPNLEVLSPSDWRMAGALLGHLLQTQGPKYIRLDAQQLPAIYDASFAPDVATGFVELLPGHETCVIATGFMTQKALACLRLNAEHAGPVGLIDMFCLHAVDEVKLCRLLSAYRHVVTYEEGFIGIGGLDGLVLDVVSRHRLAVPVTCLGIGRHYSFAMGSRQQLHAQARIGDDDLLRVLQARISMP